MLRFNTIYLGDCLDVLKELPDNIIDSVVTDPPYAYKFMNKKWDYKIPSVEIWEEILRVLKPGGHLLSFGGTKTYHRLVCNIEDAGFEIRDCLQWLYGSGFPKSINISKAIDKKLGAKGEVIGKKLLWGHNAGSGAGSFSKNNYEGKIGIKRTEDIIAPATEEAKKWDGYGTALKPAHEPIVLARKPISEKTIAENVLKWGIGGINIDECRVATNDKLSVGSNNRENGNINYGMKNNKGVQKQHEKGRWPTNILHNGSDEVLDLFETFGTNKGQQADLKGTEPSRKTSNCYGEYERQGVFKKRNDTGSAARFFYCSKASKKERGKGNNHPTVKPIKLLKYLIKLITPKGGVVLDPFIGSGSTALAADELGFSWLGVEKDEESFNIAERRVNEKIFK